MAIFPSPHGQVRAEAEGPSYSTVENNVLATSICYHMFLLWFIVCYFIYHRFLGSTMVALGNASSGCNDGDII